MLLIGPEPVFSRKQIHFCVIYITDQDKIHSYFSYPNHVAEGCKIVLVFIYIFPAFLIEFDTAILRNIYVK